MPTNNHFELTELQINSILSSHPELKKIYHDVERQHYVPQFYLKNFSNNRKTINSIKNNTTFVPSISSICYIKNMYGADSLIETLLSDLENKSSDIIGKIIDDPENVFLSIEDYGTLVYFVITMHARSRRQYEQNKKSIKMCLNNIAQMCEITDYTIHSVIEEFPCTIPLDIATRFTPDVCMLSSVLLSNETDTDFLTSDCPVCSFNPIMMKLKKNYGPFLSGCAILMPLSTNLAILIYDQLYYEIKSNEKNIVHIKLTHTIDEINKMIVCNSYEMIFYNDSKQTEYVKKISRWKKNNPEKIDDELCCVKNNLISTRSFYLKININLYFLKIINRFEPKYGINYFDHNNFKHYSETLGSDNGT